MNYHINIGYFFIVCKCFGYMHDVDFRVNEKKLIFGIHRNLMTSDSRGGNKTAKMR